jgi:hypothetical protein
MVGTVGRTWRTWAVGAALAAVAMGTVACAPAPTPGGLPSCPARQEVQLEPADPVNFSFPRAVSADGEWLVASRVVGTDMAFALRRTQGGATSTTVGTLPYAQVVAGRLLVSVPADGSQVVFGTAGTASLDTSPQTTLRRWRASTGTVADLPVPTVTSPPPGVPYPVNAAAVSADGRRVLWFQEFREGPEPYVWHRVLVVTDAATDAVVSTASVDGSWTGWVTNDGAAYLDGNRVVASATGTATDLNPDVAAAQVALPGPQLYVDGISDDLRFLALRRFGSDVGPATWSYVVWDRVAHTGRVGLQVPTTGQTGQPLFRLDAVAPGGSLVVTQWSSPSYLGDILLSDPTAGVRFLAQSASQLTPQFSWVVSTTDGRTVVLSRQGPLGHELVAERCA